MKRFLSMYWPPLAIVIVMLVPSLISCTAQDRALEQAKLNAQNRTYYIPHNDVEGRNYDWRLQISDIPSLILWCTVFPPTPGVKPFTVPIQGKLTSGGKRPFPQKNDTSENPDAQGMYGTSGDYRYGFGPSGMFEYYDLYGMPTACMTQPTVWQAQLTVLVQEKDPVLMQASQQARDAIARGDSAAAQKIIEDAIKKIQGGK